MGTVNVHDGLVELLLKGMKDQDLSQNRLAKLSGVPQGNLSSILAGRPATEATWQKLFDVLYPDPPPPPTCPHGVPVPGRCRSCPQQLATIRGEP